LNREQQKKKDIKTPKSQTNEGFNNFTTFISIPCHNQGEHWVVTTGQVLIASSGSAPYTSDACGTAIDLR